MFLIMSMIFAILNDLLKINFILICTIYVHII
nr:MAG TPA: hypothetical protein [Caudoviricetes sp.]